MVKVMFGGEILRALGTLKTAFVRTLPVFPKRHKARESLPTHFAGKTFTRVKVVLVLFQSIEICTSLSTNITVHGLWVMNREDVSLHGLAIKQLTTLVARKLSALAFNFIVDRPDVRIHMFT